MDIDLNVSLGSNEQDFQPRPESYFGDETLGENVDGISSFRPEQDTVDLNDDNSPNDVVPDHETICNDLEKKLDVGCIVDDEKKAYLLYCEYAHSKGFSVRKGEQRYIGKSDDLRWKEYLCSCAGLPDCKSSKGNVAMYKKMVTRTECKAKLRVTKSIEGQWVVTIFEVSHNHKLVSWDQTYLLRSARNLTHAKKSILEALQSVGIGVSRACGFMEKECGGPQNLGFIRRDAYAHMEAIKRHTKLENSDANALLDYFTNKSHDEPRFYYKVELDDEGRLMNFFFRDSRCMDDYGAFGDVLSVDTTYRTNRYHLICAPFVGINQHMHNVMFGMAFLSDETTGSFEWLFRAFLSSMKGKEPKVIFTDQCQAMMRAIDSCFPNSKHRLCQWHINQNAPAHFGKLNSDSSFKRLWHKCMNHVETEAEFEEIWGLMMNGFQLTGSRWFAAMYKLRKRWASVFTNSVFSAGLLATSRSEVTNRILKDISLSSVSLYEFVLNYEKIQARWRERERNEDTFNMWLPGHSLGDNPLVNHAASVYTRSVFRIFESEAINCFNVELLGDGVDLGDGNLEFKTVSAAGSERPRIVLYNINTHHASCSCRMFEREGLQCRHILKIYSTHHVRAIPQEYILNRWTKMARNSSSSSESFQQAGNVMPYIYHSNKLMRGVQDILSCIKGNDAACRYLFDRFDGVRDEIFKMFGIEPADSRSGVRAVSGAAHRKFQDPKSLRRRGFLNVRKPPNAEPMKRKAKNAVGAGAFGNL